MGMKSKLYQSFVPGMSFVGFVFSPLPCSFDPRPDGSLEQRNSHAIAEKSLGETLYF